MKTSLIKSELKSDLLPDPVEYAVLLPEDYDKSNESYPLLFFLHGGGMNRNFLEQMRPVIEQAINSGKLPKLIVVTPSAFLSFYMDFRDGTQKWEQFLI
jgi:S-formylglutathione hydrolase